MSQQDMEPHGLLSGLSEDYVLVHYHRSQHLKTAVEQVFDALAKNDGGNQFVLVLGLPESISNRRDEEDN